MRTRLRSGFYKVTFWLQKPHWPGAALKQTILWATHFFCFLTHFFKRYFSLLFPTFLCMWIWGTQMYLLLLKHIKQKSLYSYNNFTESLENRRKKNPTYAHHLHLNSCHCCAFPFHPGLCVYTSSIGPNRDVSRFPYAACLCLGFPSSRPWDEVFMQR